ncbi:MAG: cyclase family protein [Bacteroidetes bacterium]|nr:cyclase family protein [Bacteroidota bacterium]
MAASRIIDISTPLDEHTPAYAGDAAFTRTIVSAIDEDGEGYNLSRLAMSAHSGTHIDAPAHFLARGKTIDQIQPRRWISPAVVIDLPDGTPIGDEQLERQGIRTGDAVLLRANAGRSGEPDHGTPAALTLDGASYLVSRKINMVGIDALSIESDDDPSYPVHKRLLRNNILIIEGLRLTHVKAGRYTLIAAPLLVTAGDGAPARALLVQRA